MGATSTPATDVITVTNVAPTASITGALTSSLEGTPISLGSSVTDPSSVDTAAGFTYAWSVSATNGQVVSSGSGASFNFTPDDNGTYTVTLTAEDKDEATSTPATDVITVTNVAPTATFSNNSPVVENSPVTVSFTSPSDPSSVDVGAGFHYDYALSEKRF